MGVFKTNKIILFLVVISLALVSSSNAWIQYSYHCKNNDVWFWDGSTDTLQEECNNGKECVQVDDTIANCQYTGPYCGNYDCETGETHSNCPSDCEASCVDDCPYNGYRECSNPTTASACVMKGNGCLGWQHDDCVQNDQECVDGYCTDKPIDYYSYKNCIGNTLWWMTSEDDQYTPIEECPYGCSHGACIENNCAPEHYEKNCYNNRPYWFDACGNRNDALSSCDYETEKCDDGDCVPKYDNECSQNERECTNKYQYKECKYMASYNAYRWHPTIQTCPTGQKCDDDYCVDSNDPCPYECCQVGRGFQEKKCMNTATQLFTCLDYKCIKKDCGATTYYCNGNDVYFKNQCGNSKFTDCSDIEKCENGKCISSSSITNPNNGGGASSPETNKADEVMVEVNDIEEKSLKIMADEIVPTSISNSANLIYLFSEQRKSGKSNFERKNICVDNYHYAEQNLYGAIGTRRECPQGTSCNDGKCIKDEDLKNCPYECCQDLRGYKNKECADDSTCVLKVGNDRNKNRNIFRKIFDFIFVKDEYICE